MFRHALDYAWDKWLSKYVEKGPSFPLTVPCFLQCNACKRVLDARYFPLGMNDTTTCMPCLVVHRPRL